MILEIVILCKRAGMIDTVLSQLNTSFLLPFGRCPWLHVLSIHLAHQRTWWSVLNDTARGCQRQISSELHPERAKGYKQGMLYTCGPYFFFVSLGHCRHLLFNASLVV